MDSGITATDSVLSVFSGTGRRKVHASAIRQAMQKENGYDAFEQYCEVIYKKQSMAKGLEKVKEFEAYCAHQRDTIAVRMSGGNLRQLHRAVSQSCSV